MNRPVDMSVIEAVGSMQRALNWIRDHGCAADVKAIRPGPEPTIEFRSVPALLESLKGTGATPIVIISRAKFLWRVVLDNFRFEASDPNHHNSYTAKLKSFPTSL